MNAVAKPSAAFRLRHYQEEGIDFLLAHPQALLADDMGLGKTVQALGAAFGSRRVPVLVVCPASVKQEWPAMWYQMNPHLDPAEMERFVHVIHGRSSRPLPRGKALVVVNYDVVASHQDALASYGFQTIILDEGHYIKNRRAKRTQAVLSLKSTIPHRYILSGTPMTNRPEELWTLLTFLGKANPVSYREFTARYADGHLEDYGYGPTWIAKGATHLHELHQRLRPFTLRRLKSDVLDELPDRTRQSLRWTIRSKRYNEAQQDFLTWYWKETHKDLTDNPAQFMVELNKLRELAEVEKVSMAVDFLRQYEEADHPILVFCNYRETMAVLRSKFPEAGVIDGSTGGTKRLNTIRGFQQGKFPLLFLNLQSGSEGLNLQRADSVLFLGYPWTPAQFHQAEDRIYRMGQQNAVTTFMPVAFPIDVMMVDMLSEKEDTFNALFAHGQPMFPRIAKNFAHFLKTGDKTH